MPTTTSTLLADLGDRDLREQAQTIAADRPLHSGVFFGGGTPSLLMIPGAIAHPLGNVAALSRAATRCGGRMETNPRDGRAHSRFEDYLGAGVNRLSFGIQASTTTSCAASARIHSASEAERAIRLARDAGFDNFNIDLMYALPQQSLDGAIVDVSAIACSPRTSRTIS